MVLTTPLPDFRCPSPHARSNPPTPPTTTSTQELSAIQAGGLEAHEPYGTFVLDTGGSVVVSHLDGHDARNSERFNHVDKSKVEKVKLMNPSEMRKGGK